jgi:hypothetical protein
MSLDRCGHEVAHIVDTPPSGWARIAFEPASARVGSGERNDLCRACFSEFTAWFSQPPRLRLVNDADLAAE